MFIIETIFSAFRLGVWAFAVTVLLVGTFKGLSTYNKRARLERRRKGA